MAKRIVVLQGHPDPQGNRFGHALAEAYARGAEEAGREVVRIAVAELDFPLLRSKEEWETGAPPPSILEAQQAIRWAEHLVILYPLWLGTMPALFKGFLEQVFRPGFAIGAAEPGRMAKKLLTGKSARIIVTMGMPAFFYRWYFRAHGVKGLKRNVLAFSGISPVRTSLIGTVEANETHRQNWLIQMHALGWQGL